jgi:hypothetical protein
MSENRETTNADMYQVLPRLAGDIASSRAEETRSLFTNMGLNEPHVRE